MASFSLHRSSHQHTSAVERSSGSAHPSAAKSPQRYYRVDAGWESSRAIYALAADTGLSHPEAVVAWMHANTYCVHVPAARNGRFDFTSANDLAGVCRLPHRVSPYVFLQACIRHGFVISRYGRLFNAGFKDRYSVTWEHQRADALQAQERRQHELAQHARRERARRQRRKDDVIEMRSSERMPGRAPLKPPVLSLVPPTLPPTHTPTQAPTQARPDDRGLANERLKMAQAADLADQMLEPKQAACPPRYPPRIPPRDSYNASIGSLDASCEGQRRIQSIGSPPALPGYECNPPTLDRFTGNEGSEHVRLESGDRRKAETIVAEPAKALAAVDLDCAKDMGSLPASGALAPPQELAVPSDAASTMLSDGHLLPADFAKRAQALFACPAVSDAIVEVFKGQLGADWALVRQLLGADVPHELNRMGAREKEGSLGMLLRSHHRSHLRRRAAEPAPAQSGDDLLAALGVHKPAPQAAVASASDDRPVPVTAVAGPPAPSRDSVPAIIRRVVGERAGEVYAGPDLIKRVEALRLGPERVELAFKAAAQRPPDKFSSLGWAALTRMERVAGLRPLLEGDV